MDYRKEWLPADVLAGLITAAVVIPKAVAYATIAGVPLQAGLYTALVPMAIYALLGASRPLSVSTTTTIAILCAAQLAPLQGGGCVDPRTLATLTVLSGAFLCAGAVLRLGFVADLISEPVLVGFKAGIGCLIVVDQVPKLLGVHVTKGSFLHNLGATALALPRAALPTAALGAGTIALLVALRKWAPRLPAPLVAVGASIACSALWPSAGIDVVGAIPTGFPSLTLPDLQSVAALWPGALGIALMSFTETIAAGRAFARTDEPAVNPNRELFATGIANAGAAFLGAMPGGGGTSQTAINRLAGARSQMAALVTAGTALATLFFLAPALGRLPQATLAGIVIVYSVGLIRPDEFLAILRIRRLEFLWAVVALVGVLLLGTLQGIVVAIVVSLLALSHKTADPPVYVLGRKPGTNVFRPCRERHPGDETFPGLLLLRVEGPVFFANAERLAHKIRPLISADRPRVVAFDLAGVFDLEYTGLKMLLVAERRLREEGIATWLVGLNPDVLGVVLRSELRHALGHGRLHVNLESAVAAYLASSVEAA